jgi:ketosteroid isomerase-like protein
LTSNQITWPSRPRSRPLQPSSEAVATDPHQDARDFLQKYWVALTTGDIDNFGPMVAEDCVVHYPGNHFLSGDHVGRAAILDLYRKLYKIGIEQGTFIGEFHDATTSDDHVCALIKYTIVLGAGQKITGEAVGVFHLEDGQMQEYWLLERDQRMINDLFALSGKASLSGGGNKALALGVLTHPLAVVRMARRVVRQRRGTNTKMV